MTEPVEVKPVGDAVEVGDAAFRVGGGNQHVPVVIGQTGGLGAAVREHAGHDVWLVGGAAANAIRVGILAVIVIPNPVLERSLLAMLHAGGDVSAFRKPVPADDMSLVVMGQRVDVRRVFAIGLFVPNEGVTIV